MTPHFPSDRREGDSPEYGATAPPTDPGVTTERTRSTARAMLVAALVLAAIIALIVLL